MKTAKMMQDFNWLCNLDVNHKLFLIFIIKVVYLCTLHNKIISPATSRCLRVVAANAHLIQQYKCLNPEIFPRLNADFLIVMVRYSLVLLVHQLANKFDLCNGCKALTSCQKELHPVAICDHISVTLGGRLLPTRMQVQLNRASISPLTRPASDSGKNSGSACFGFAFSQPAISPRRGIITFLSHDLCMMGSGAKL